MQPHSMLFVYRHVRFLSLACSLSECHRQTAAFRTRAFNDSPDNVNNRDTISMQDLRLAFLRSYLFTWPGSASMTHWFTMCRSTYRAINSRMLVCVCVPYSCVTYSTRLCRSLLHTQYAKASIKDYHIFVSCN